MYYQAGYCIWQYVKYHKLPEIAAGSMLMINVRTRTDSFIFERWLLGLAFAHKGFWTFNGERK